MDEIDRGMLHVPVHSNETRLLFRNNKYDFLGQTFREKLPTMWVWAHADLQYENTFNSWGTDFTKLTLHKSCVWIIIIQTNEFQITNNNFFAVQATYIHSMHFWTAKLNFLHQVYNHWDSRSREFRWLIHQIDRAYTVTDNLECSTVSVFCRRIGSSTQSVLLEKKSNLFIEMIWRNSPTHPDFQLAAIIGMNAMQFESKSCSIVGNSSGLIGQMQKFYHTQQCRIVPRINVNWSIWRFSILLFDHLVENSLHQRTTFDQSHIGCLQHNIQSHFNPFVQSIRKHSIGPGRQR